MKISENNHAHDFTRESTQLPCSLIYSVQSNLVISNITVYVNLVHIVVVTLLAGHPRLVFSFMPSLCVSIYMKINSWQRLVFHSYDTPNQENGGAKIL